MKSAVGAGLIIIVFIIESFGKLQLSFSISERLEVLEYWLEVSNNLFEVEISLLSNIQLKL